MNAPLPFRELYAVAHFGSSYEAMWPREMRAILSEAKHWGFTSYADWFDPADLKDPHDNPKRERLVPQVYWERKLSHFRTATDLGLTTTLLTTPNHVFSNQLREDLLADDSDPKHFGQLLCPSIPEARETILRNHRALFKDLRNAGVELGSVVYGPYDYGGCGCDACRPWIVTFGRLAKDIHNVAREIFPEVRARLCGWWWTPEEHTLFSEWADREAAGLFSGLAGYVPYGETGPDAALPRPAGCAHEAFVHIGYADKAQPKDVYGHWGPVVAAGRIEATVANLRRQRATGFMAYSEGVFDDVNKVLLAGLSSGAFGSAEDVLREYAARYFGGRESDASAWARWLRAWGEPFSNDVDAARREFDRLAPKARPGWRFDQFEQKLRMFEAHRDVLARSDWDGERSAAAERFYGEKERLWRGVWKLGLVRHILHDDFGRPPWRDEWLRAGDANRSTASGDLPEDA